MKTTLDLPDNLLIAARALAAQRKTTQKALNAMVVPPKSVCPRHPAVPVTPRRRLAACPPAGCPKSVCPQCSPDEPSEGGIIKKATKESPIQVNLTCWPHALTDALA